MPSEITEPDIPVEFTRPEVVAIIRSVINYHTPEEARQIGPEYLLEKYELKKALKEKGQSFP